MLYSVPANVRDVPSLLCGPLLLLLYDDGDDDTPPDPCLLNEGEEDVNPDDMRRESLSI